MLISLKMRIAAYETGERDEEDDEEDGDGGGHGSSGGNKGINSSSGNASSSSSTPRYKFTDMGIVRFIRGRKMDENKACRALLRHISWRQDLRVADITLESVRSEVDKRKILVWGRDTQMRPVLYIFANRHKTSERDLVQMQDFIIHTLGAFGLGWGWGLG